MDQPRIIYFIAPLCVGRRWHRATNDRTCPQKYRWSSWLRGL